MTEGKRKHLLNDEQVLPINREDHFEVHKTDRVEFWEEGLTKFGESEVHRVE